MSSAKFNQVSFHEIEERDKGRPMALHDIGKHGYGSRQTLFGDGLALPSLPFIHHGLHPEWRGALRASFKLARTHVAKRVSAASGCKNACHWKWLADSEIYRVDESQYSRRQSKIAERA
jgi:hypothetical protein